MQIVLDERAPRDELGLSIVSTLAASCGGTLTPRHADPTGLRATISLPDSMAP